MQCPSCGAARRELAERERLVRDAEEALVKAETAERTTAE